MKVCESGKDTKPEVKGFKLGDVVRGGGIGHGKYYLVANIPAWSPTNFEFALVSLSTGIYTRWMSEQNCIGALGLTKVNGCFQIEEEE